MASKTFYNLPQGRQQEILDIAYKEFVTNSYELASLNHIIKEIGIAKGSFYRYFKNKFALYKFLIDNLNQVNLANFSMDSTQNYDLYRHIKSYLLKSYVFDKQYPRYSAFLYRVNRNRSTPELDQLISKYETHTLTLFMEILKKHYKVTNAIPPKNLCFVAHNILHLLNGMIDYLSLKYNLNYTENIAKELPLFDILEKDYKSEVINYIKVIKKIIEGGT